MSKQSLDLEYMQKAVSVKTGVRAGVAAPRPLYGVLYAIPMYGIPLYGIITAE